MKNYDRTIYDVPNLEVVCKETERQEVTQFQKEGLNFIPDPPVIDYIVISTNKIHNIRRYFGVLFGKSLYALYH